jgi:hypothetical protein
LRPSIRDARICGHIMAGDQAGAQFWARVAEAVRLLRGGNLVALEIESDDAT